MLEKNILSKFEYGIYIITSREHEIDNGCVINTAMQVGSIPCQIGVSINKKSYTGEIICKTKEFNISILSQESDMELIQLFGYKSGRDVNKFENFKDCERSENGIYYINKGINGYLSAIVKQEIDLTSHYLFIAGLTDAVNLSNTKTLTYDYYQNFIKPKSQTHNKKGWVCKICGYFYDDELLPEDYICPVCKHNSSYFEKVNF